MQSRLGIVALAVALAALGVAVIPSTPELAPPSNSDARIGELEEQVARLQETVEELRLRQPRDGNVGEPTLRGVLAAGQPLPGSPGQEDATAALKAMVDEAVDKKAKEVVDELEVKEDKEPSIDLLSRTLELDDAQRRAVEDEVIRGQREAFAILETPTQSGDNLMDELVELVARSIAWPKKEPAWGPWFVKVMTEKVPGTDETYAAQVDAVKKTVLDNFKRTMSEEQYAEYEEWGVDPIEIEDISGSPGEALNERWLERARQLTEQYPDGPPR